MNHLTSHKENKLKFLVPRRLLRFTGVGICAIGILCLHAADSSDSALIGHWKFDEASGEKVTDSSGKGNHGVLRGATRAAGKLSGAVECKQDALVEIPRSATLDDLKNGMTISAWVNRAADGTWNMIVSREIKEGPSEYFGLAVVKNKALFSVDPDGAHYKNIKSAEDMPVGEWIHLAGSYDNSDFKLYVNGKLAASQKMDLPMKQEDDNPLIIGGNTNTRGKAWVDCFHGKIDDVRLYNRALNAEQIAALAAAK